MAARTFESRDKYILLYALVLDYSCVLGKLNYPAHCVLLILTQTLTVTYSFCSRRVIFQNSDLISCISDV